MKKTVAIIFLAIILVSNIYSESTEEITVEKIVNWQDGTVIFDLSAPIDEKSLKPTSRFEAEQLIETQAPYLIIDSLADITYDSWNTLNEIIEINPDIYHELENLSSGLIKTFSKTSEEMDLFTIRYTLNIYPEFVSLFVKHQRNLTIDSYIGFENEESEFTGIVIYAGDYYNVHGSEIETMLNPSLFLKIFSEESMEIIYQKEFLTPQALSQWGMVQYSNTTDFTNYSDRVGTRPLRINARSLFGKNGTDIIISEEDAKQILSIEAISHLLRDGKVVIISPLVN